LLGEALRCEIRPRFVLYTEEALRLDGRSLLNVLAQREVPVYQVSAEVMACCSDTVTPSGLLAVVPFPDIPAPVGSTWTLVVDSIRTPGNLGAILRTAAAAGVEQVLLSPGTVDMYNPKVVRGGAGVHFFLSVLPLSWPEIGARLRGLRVWLAATEGDVSYTNVDWIQPLGLIIGGEARGASPSARSLAEGSVTIPMAHSVESLNAAVAVGVLLFEIARQRRAAERAKE
jgi:TrmH family RNA methyltransferase